MQKNASWLFLFDENSTGECLCMDGKEVTCAWAPPAKFRSAKGNDYAGELFFFYKSSFVYLFFKFTGHRRGVRKEKSGKNLRVRFLQKSDETKDYFKFQFYRRV